MEKTGAHEAWEIREENLSELDEYSDSVFLEENQYLFYRDHIPHGLYILVSGQISIENDDSSPFKVAAPAVLGSEAFFSNRPYLVSARADTDCKALFIRRMANSNS